MPIELDSGEILKYLNHLGYYNITGEQLKHFIKDLKKLIKYEQKKSTLIQDQENVEPSRTHVRRAAKEKNNVGYYEFNHDKVSKQLNVDLVDESTDAFSILHSTSTVSSRAKEVPRKENIISVEILQPRIKPLSSNATLNETKTRESSVPSSYTNREASTSKASGSVSNFTGKTKVQSHSADNIHRINELKPKASFIRPRRPVKTCKSDPVALYQQYQAEWNKQKLPGEDKHFDLRWAIRERMLGEPHIRPATSTDKVSKRNSRI